MGLASGTSAPHGHSASPYLLHRPYHLLPFTSSSSSPSPAPSCLASLPPLPLLLSPFPHPSALILTALDSLSLPDPPSFPPAVAPATLLQSLFLRLCILPHIWFCLGFCGFSILLSLSPPPPQVSAFLHLPVSELCVPFPHPCDLPPPVCCSGTYYLLFMVSLSCLLSRSSPSGALLPTSAPLPSRAADTGLCLLQLRL